MKKKIEAKPIHQPKVEDELQSMDESQLAQLQQKLEGEKQRRRLAQIEKDKESLKKKNAVFMKSLSKFRKDSNVTNVLTLFAHHNEDEGCSDESPFSGHYSKGSRRPACVRCKLLNLMHYDRDEVVIEVDIRIEKAPWVS